MTAIHAEPAPVPVVATDGVEIGYITSGDLECRTPLAGAWSTPFESGRPVRRFTSRKGQRHLSGLWWSATVAGHVGFESWLERDHLMLLDFDPKIVGMASQPFWLRWADDDGKSVSHAPDFFARRADGSAVVIDCRPIERRPARDVTKFDATARACATVGWEYRLVGATDEVVTANVRWLAGYRHPRHHIPEMATALHQAFAKPTPLLTGAEGVGDPMAVLPMLFHLMWCHELLADLSVPLHVGTVVTGAEESR